MSHLSLPPIHADWGPHNVLRAGWSHPFASPLKQALAMYLPFDSPNRQRTVILRHGSFLAHILPQKYSAWTLSLVVHLVGGIRSRPGRLWLTRCRMKVDAWSVAVHLNSFRSVFHYRRKTHLSDRARCQICANN